MKVSVFDTYVTKKDGDLMHFDIIVPEKTDFEQVIDFGRKYLTRKGQQGQAISSKECSFCHLEHLQKFMEQDLRSEGYHIIEMKGC
jgi:Domain of unknown function (DUF2024)